jgi:hypothetical protein
MAITLTFLCAVMTKRSIAFNYPDGMPGFRRRYRQLREDQWLVALCAMSGGDLDFILDELAKNGLHVGRHVAVGDMWGGPFDEAPGINFVAKHPRDGLAQWTAEIADEDVTLENRPIVVTRRDPYPGETFLGGSGVIIPLRFDDPPKARPGGSGTEDIAMLAAHNAIEDALERGFARAMARRAKSRFAPDDDASTDRPD